LKYYEPRHSEQLSREGDAEEEEQEQKAHVEDVHVVYQYEELHQKQFRFRRHLMSQGTNCNMDSETETALDMDESEPSEEKIVREKYISMVDDISAVNVVNAAMTDEVVEDMETDGGPGGGAYGE